MSEPLVIDTLEKLVVKTCEDSTGYECFHNKFTKSDKPYIVYNYMESNEFYDNKALFRDYLVMIHLVSPYGIEMFGVKEKLKLDLQAAGFIYPSETDASDEDYQHYVLESRKGWNVAYGNS